MLELGCKLFIYIASQAKWLTLNASSLYVFDVVLEMSGRAALRDTAHTSSECNMQHDTTINEPQQGSMGRAHPTPFNRRCTPVHCHPCETAMREPSHTRMFVRVLAAGKLAALRAP